MAKAAHPIITIILVVHMLIAMAMAGRDIMNPESFIKHDRGYLIPGIGRGIKPKCKDGFNPFTYNPVTGGNNGGIRGGYRLPVFGGVGGGRYVPGGDDTLVPNPGSEIPNPGSGTTTPGPVHN